MTDINKPSSRSSKNATEKEGIFLSPDAVLHNNLYTPPSSKTLNDNKGSFKDAFKKFQGLIILAFVAVVVILLLNLS